MKRSFYCLTLIFLFPVLLSAQERTVKNGNQQWVQYYNQTKLTSRWTLLLDGGYRWRDGFSQGAQYLVRFGAGFNVNSVLRLAAGFAHLGFLRGGVIDKIEFRPYQEILLRQDLENLKLGHRFRVEERSFQLFEDGKYTGESSFNYRFRYRFFVNIPLFKCSKKQADRWLILGVGDEIFINGGRLVIHNFFDQNRILIGPILQFNEQFGIRLTGNFQFASTNAPDIFKYSKIFWLGINHKLDLKK